MIYPKGFENFHYKAVIPTRNKFMVDNASYALCYQSRLGRCGKDFYKNDKKNIKTINIGTYGGC